MEHFQAFLVITLLTSAVVSVSGTTREISMTTGDTVNIPCVFGEGTLRNIFWYYNDGSGPQKILFLSSGVLAKGPEYEDRASLQNDNSTLILEDIVVADEGTYRCDVDRQGQTPVPNINTKLNVFSLRPDTLPVITPNCTWADEFSPCIIHANQFVTLTCTLPNIHPVHDAELIWYQDGKHIPSTPDITQNEDGTTNISEQIQVSETAHFTCNATYLSVNGKENTAASVIPPADVPQKMTSGQIAGMTIGIVLGVGICLAIIIFATVSLKARGNCSFSNDAKSDATSCKAGDGDPPKLQNRKDDSQLVQEYSKLLGTSAEEVSKDEKVNNSTLPPSPTMTQEGNVNRSDERKISDKEILELSKHMPGSNYSNFCVALNIDINQSTNIKAKHQINYPGAFEEILKAWKTKTGGFTQDLDDALVEAELGGLRDQYKM